MRIGYECILSYFAESIGELEGRIVDGARVSDAGVASVSAIPGRLRVECRFEKLDPLPSADAILRICRKGRSAVLDLYLGKQQFPTTDEPRPVSISVDVVLAVAGTP